MEFMDEYEHINPNVIYTPENIPTKATENDFSEISVGCKCRKECTPENNCNCLGEKINYKFRTCEDDLESVQNNYKVAKMRTPIYECNIFCKCPKFCSNRLVQYGPRKHLKVIACTEKKDVLHGDDEKNYEANGKLTCTKGLGLHTINPIEMGNFVCEYAGEVISQKEANDRFKLQERLRQMNYIFCINETFGSNSVKTFVDPTKFGNVGRYINHSCHPNCEVIPVRVTCITPKLCVFAKEDIAANTELTFDYGDGDVGSESDNKKPNRKRCLCGYFNCRKFLPYHSTD